MRGKEIQGGSREREGCTDMTCERDCPKLPFYTSDTDQHFSPSVDLEQNRQGSLQDLLMPGGGGGEGGGGG